MSGTDRPPRIAFINHWARNLGGAEFSLLDLLSEASRRADVILITSEGGILVDRARKLKIECRIIFCSPLLGEIKRDHLFSGAFRMSRALLSFVHYLILLRKTIRELQPDIIHANVPKSHIAVSLLARTGYTGNCFYHIREIFNARSLAYWLYQFLLPGRNSHLIAISNAVKDALPPRLTHLTKVIYNGVGVISELPVRTTSGPLRFLYLGRIVPWKGCHLLIEAFAALAKKRGAAFSATLTLVGGTHYWNQHYRNELRNLIAAHGIDSCCTILEHTESPLDFMKSSDVFCLGSDREPFGRVAAEAQACGLPVVGFDSGGLPEVIENGITGVLVRFGDIHSFTAALERFIDNPEAGIIMGRRGHERVCELFDRDKQIPLMIDHMLGKTPAY